MSRILIKNGRVWDGEKFTNCDVLVENSLIAQIDSNIKSECEFEYDATGKTVTPGLVDLHTHMLGIYGINAEMSCIPFGVTAAADAFAERDSKEKYDNFLVKNRVFVCAEFVNNKVKHENIIKQLQHYKKKAIGIKVYFDKSASDICNTSPLKEIVSYAHENNLIVMVHPSQSPSEMSEIVEALKKGDILTHIYHGGINNALCDNFEALKEARRKGVVLDAGFAGHIHTDFDILKKAINEGVLPDTISTDITKFSAYKRGGRYGMTTCMSMAKSVGMSEEDIFKAITSTPAKALQKEKEWGCLKVGRTADIAVFDYTNQPFDLTDNSGNRLASNKGYRCVLTVCDGQIVYRD